MSSFKDFTSLAEKNNQQAGYRTARDGMDTLIKDEYFKSMLNTDLAVQIEDYIYRVNPISEKVFALPAANANQYQDLISENIQNPALKEFSFNENVLEAIKNIGGDPTPKALFCGESGIGGYDRTTGVINIDNAGTIKMEGKIHFNKYGIYFSLFAEVQTGTSGLTELTIDLVPVYYKIKCGGSAGPYNVYGYGGGSLLNYKKFQSYQGSKNLNKVYFRAMFHGKINLPGGGTFTKDSPWIEIRVNY